VVLLYLLHYPFNIEASVFLNGVHWLLCIKTNTMKKLPELNELQKIFTYDPVTGVLTRNGRPITCQNKYGHVVLNIKSVQYYAHRIVYYLYHGIQDGCIDHIDGNPANNKIDNLALKSHKSNLRNQKLRNTNTSGCMGVYKYGSNWRSRIKVDGEFLHLGIYNTKEKAIQARKHAEALYGFHPNHGRP